MSKEHLALLTIIDSIDRILEYSKQNQNADDFYHDTKSFDACMIHFINIGEMMERLSSEFKSEHSNIPWQEIKDFRNLVAHNHLPDLKQNIYSLLS